MGEIEGTYRVLQTPGSRLGPQKSSGISTLEPGQNLWTTSSSVPVKNGDLQLKVKLLDETMEAVNVELKCQGQILLSEVFKHLNLIETDYFGIEVQNKQSYWTWLEPMKQIDKQVGRPKNTLLRLAVKFFPPDPGQLQEEYTRYLFALQIKRDLAEERLSCSDNTAALIISHLLQSEIGDYDELGDREHLRKNHYLPHQETVQEKIMEFHQKNMGQTPAESDFQVLEIARKLEMYGIRFHLASDREGTQINLAVSHMGVMVFQGKTKINTFNWSKIRKLSFKRRRFLIKLHPEVHGPYQDTLEFLLGNRDQCKNFWKICVEYHTFFRLLDQPKPKPKPVLFSRGSSFRYSGRTQKQLVDYVRDSGMRKAPYERRQSKGRISARILITDTPKQNLSFNECMILPGPLSSLQALQPSSTAAVDPPLFPDHNLLDPRSPTSRSPTDWSVLVPATEEGSSRKLMELPGSPVIQSFQGVVSCSTVQNCSPAYHLDVVKSNVEIQVMSRKTSDDGAEGDIPSVASNADNKCYSNQPQGMPPFTLTTSQLQLTEEFIDDDPTEMSFFGGGSEAFSYSYSDVNPEGQDLHREFWEMAPMSNQNAPLQSSGPVVGSPRHYYSHENPMNPVCDLEFLERSDFNGNAHPSDTSDLFEVKAQASRMHCLLSPSESSSLINNRSESSSLNNLPLNGVPSLHIPSSGNHSEGSSMVNFPAYSVRSESSSAIQFTDIIDQLEQLSYPPTTTEDSSSTDTDSWDSETGTPLDVNLFFSNPFAQASGESFSFDFQNNLKNMAQGEQKDKAQVDLG